MYGMSDAIRTAAEYARGANQRVLHLATLTAACSLLALMAFAPQSEAATASAPLVILYTPTAGAIYTQNQIVNASYSCKAAWGGKPIASCVGTVPNGSPIDTATYGAKSFTVTATDTSGKQSSVTHSYTVKDVTRPTISISTPLSGAVYAITQPVTSSFSCQDESGGSGLAKCAATTINSAGKVVQLNAASGSALYDAVAGTYKFIVTATDKAGNVALKSVTYTVTSQPPTVVITTPTGNQQIAVGSVVNAAFSCTDGSGTGIKSCTSTTTNSSGSAVQSNATSGTSLYSLAAGTYTFTAAAVSNNGSSTSRSVTYSVTAPPPSITINTPGNGPPGDGSQFALGSNVLSWFYCTDNSGTGIAFGGCVARTTDVNGNQVYPSQSSGTSLFTTTAGVYTFTVTATDNAGDVGVRSVTYTVSAPPPAISIASPSANQQVALGSVAQSSFTCVDASGSGIKQCDATTTVVGGGAVQSNAVSDTPLFTASAGNYTFTVTVVDNQGDTSTAIVGYSVATAPLAPTIAIASPSEGQVVGQGLIARSSFTCTDYSGTGISECDATISDSSGNVVFSKQASGIALPSFAAGTFTFTVTALDNAGDSTTATRHYVVAGCGGDCITINAPANGSFYTRGTAVNSSFSCADSTGTGIASCTSSTTDQTGAVVQSNAASGAPISTATSGNHVFTVTSVANDGTTYSLSHTYSVNGPSPTVTITSPSVNMNVAVGQVVNSGFTCVDQSGTGIGSCTATTLNSSGSVVQDNAPSGTPLYTGAAGTYNFTVHAIDNVYDASAYTTYYTVVPIAISAPTPSQTISPGASLNAAFACGDPAGGGIVSCTATTTDQSGTTVQSNASSGTPVYSATAGVYTLTVTAVSTVGTTYTQAVTYHVGTLPTVNITSPVANERMQTGALLNSAFTCTDNSGSGIANCTATTKNGSGTVVQANAGSGTAVYTAAPSTYTLTVTAVDNQGTVATKSVVYSVCNCGPGPIQLTTPYYNQTIAVGSVTNSAFACTDYTGSGIASCASTTTNSLGATVQSNAPRGAALYSAVAGTYTFTVTYVDNYGAINRQSVQYVVS